MEYNSNIPSREPMPQTDDNALTIKDIWALCISHWKWFALSLAVCLAGAAFYVFKSVPVYTRNASVLIKEDRKSGTVAGDISSAFNDLGMSVTKVNVNNEIVNFTSPDLLLQVAKNLELNVDYKLKAIRYLHTLYGSSLPVKVEFLDLPVNAGASLTLDLVDTASVRLSEFTRGGDKIKSKDISAAYGDTTDTPLGKVLVTKSKYADQAQWGRAILVTHTSPQNAARACRGRLSADINGKNTTVIDLTYRDVNTQRAEDVLRMIINCYNENWIKDKNQITTSTNEFIADRLRIIEQELGSVDKTITSYRSAHRLPDDRTAIQMDMQLSAEAGKHLMELNNQLSIARFLQSDIRGAAPGTLLPANVGLEDPGTQAQ
nr:chromosome partitioning protein ParA [Bacteroidales bacterium]